MNRDLKLAVLGLLLVFTVLFLLKLAQTACWRYDLIAPPSLDSWDPTERVEAARQAIKNFGGKQ